jgi:transposase InsO family protein
MRRTHHNRCGNPRVREELRRQYGKGVSRKKAARLMRKNGLNPRARRKRVLTTNSRHGLAVCENILSQIFHAEADGQKWVSDITCPRALGGWVCLTVILDMFDRKVIGWH